MIPMSGSGLHEQKEKTKTNFVEVAPLTNYWTKTPCCIRLRSH